MNVEKFKAKPKAELVNIAIRNEKAKENDKQEEAQTAGRLTRFGSNAAASTIFGVAFAMKPGLRNIMGSPVGIQHIGAAVGLVTAFASDDEMTQNVAEGVGQSGLTLSLLALGQKLATVGK